MPLTLAPTLTLTLSLTLTLTLTRTQVDSAGEGGASCFSCGHHDPHDLWGLQEDPHEPGMWYCTSCWRYWEDNQLPYAPFIREDSGALGAEGAYESAAA